MSSKLMTMKNVNSSNKDTFHNAGKRQLRVLAKLVGLNQKEFEVRSCYGGPAVAGEVILHTDKFYLQLFQSALGSDGIRIMYRECKGRTDYTGGQNRYEKLEKLHSTEFVNTLKKLQSREI